MASTLLIRASAEAKALRPNAALAARLVQRWRSVKLEPLEIKVRIVIQFCTEKGVCQLPGSSDDASS